jgi:small-conductance mechanosensitive channel
MEFGTDWLEQLRTIVIPLLAGAAVGFGACLVIAFVNRLLARREGGGVIEPVYRRVAGPLRIFLPALGVLLALSPLREDIALAAIVVRVVGILLIAVGAYLLIRLVYGVEDFIEQRLGLDRADNLEARRTYTQLRVLRRVLVAFIGFTAFIVILLSFEGARQIGAGLLASAGLAGLVIGFAAQRALGNLLAGFQIAVTQPIRIDDVVVVEGEWGRVEEITLTYVVIRIWDERRLVLPISYFLEQPFTNWTRENSQILGTVFLYTDYNVPIDALRAELDRIVEASSHWDGRFKNLVVTESKPTVLELRALVSARDGGTAWDLRCEVREGLIGFLQREYPESLPRFRAELTQLPEPS